MEIRLQQSSWYQQTDIFRTEGLVVACAEAVPVRSDLGLRLKRCESEHLSGPCNMEY